MKKEKLFKAIGFFNSLYPADPEFYIYTEEDTNTDLTKTFKYYLFIINKLDLDKTSYSNFLSQTAILIPPTSD